MPGSPNPGQALPVTNAQYIKMMWRDIKEETSMRTPKWLGLLAAISLLTSMTAPAAARTPLRSHARPTQTVWVTNPVYNTDNSNLVAIDVKTGAQHVLGSGLPAGIDSVLVSRPVTDTLAYVTAGNATGQLLLLDLVTGAWHTLITLPKRPEDMRFTPDHQHILISLSAGGPLALYSIATNTYVLWGAITDFPEPQGLTYTPSGQLWINDGLKKSINRVDSRTGVILESHVLGGYYADGLTYDTKTRLFYIGTWSNGALISYNPRTHAVKPVYSGLGTIDGVAADGAGHVFVVSYGGGVEDVLARHPSRSHQLAGPPATGMWDDIVAIENDTTVR